MEERSCILSYFLPSCNRTMQSMLLYNEESSHCDQYKLPSIYGEVTSYQCFYNLNCYFATTTSQDGEKVCHLWNVKLVTTAKKPKRHVDAQKCLLSSKLLISLDCMNNSNRPATLLAYEVRIYKSLRNFFSFGYNMLRARRDWNNIIVILLSLERTDCIPIHQWPLVPKYRRNKPE